jgi:integrase
MSTRTHGGNKYSKPQKQSVVAGRFVTQQNDDVIRVELNPEHARTLNFAFLNGHPELKKALLAFFHQLGARVQPITKSMYFRTIQQFVRFLKEFESGNDLPPTTTIDIDAHLLLNFRVWLENRPVLTPAEEGTSNKLSSITIVTMYANFLFILKQLRAFDPDLFPALPTRLPKRRAVNVHVKPAKDVLSPDELARILAAAESDAKLIRQRYEEIQIILERTKDLPVGSLKTKTPDYWRSLDNAVHSTIRENGIPFKAPRSLSRVLRTYQNTSQTKLLGNYLPVGQSALLPFALILFVRTALNVSSLLTLTRDCISNFPLPQYKRLVYDKPRSGTARAKSQIIPAKRSTSNGSGGQDPIEIVEFLLKWTQPLLEFAPPKLRNSLFIFRTANMGAAPQIVRPVHPKEPFPAGLSEFIARHKLPNFSLGSLRAAVASYIYLSTKNVHRVQRFLGHRSVLTTLRYIRGQIVAREHDKSMAGAIELMVRRILHSAVNYSGKANNQTRNLPIRATIIEGTQEQILIKNQATGTLSTTDRDTIKHSGVMVLLARCRAPDQPPAFLKVPDGQLCTKIFKCLSCSNAVVLEEDLPGVLLRIDQIWKEQKRLTPEGWQILYEDVWLALNQVVRLFSPEAQRRASLEIANRLLPLE